jgi:hypothetical protein
MFSPSNNHDRDSLLGAHEAADDCAEWAVNQHRIDALRLGAEHRAREDREATQRLRVLMESGNHFAQCRGHSCRQGRVACREACNRPAEGILVHDDAQTDKPPLGWWGRHFGWLLG